MRAATPKLFWKISGYLSNPFLQSPNIPVYLLVWLAVSHETLTGARP